jgi:flagellar hook-associated protein 1 FlgK
MSLTRSLDVARSHLSATAEYMQVASRNVARANDPAATRKVASVVTSLNGFVRVGGISRSENEILLSKALSARSDASRDSTILNSLNQINEVVGDPELETSPALMIQKFERSLQFYSEATHDLSRAQAAVRSARDLATGLNAASQQTQLVRQQADNGIANAVTSINTLLGRFETLNNDIVRGTEMGRDVTDMLDARDQIVAELAGEFGLRTELRENNDMAIRTDSGVTLFDKTPRKLSFQASGAFSAATNGNAIYADGIPITGAGAIMPINSGRLAGLVQVRDVAAVQFQSQLDEIARGLVEAFAESDQVGSGPDQAGLFTYAGGPAVPPSGVRVVGLAATLRVNAAVDPDQGGVVTRLRDGGINGAGYVYNTTGAAGYNARVLDLAGGLASARAFDASAGIGASASLIQFSASTDGWLASARKTAQDGYDYTSVVSERSSDALSKVTGINVQEEFLVMLELERSYQASSKLIATIDSMFDSLLAAAR